MPFVPSQFFTPAPPARNENQFAPPAIAQPLPGPSKFVQSASQLATFAAGHVAVEGPTLADEYLASQIARAASIRPAAPVPRIRVAAGSEAGGAPPHIQMPVDGKPFSPVGHIATPAKDDLEYTIVSFPVPFGMDGVITAVYLAYQGPSFEEGAGDMTWALKADGQAFRNYGVILTQLGDKSEWFSIPGGLVVKSNQQITATVIHAATSSLPIAGTRVSAGLKGWFYPKR